MELTGETVEDQIEVVYSGTFPVVQVRTVTIIKRDGVEISRSPSRHVVSPDSDISGESKHVQEICALVHTQEVKEAYAAHIAAQGANMEYAAAQPDH